MLFASLFARAVPAAILGQAVPVYHPIPVREPIPHAEIVHYIARCEGLDVDVRYRVQRPAGSTVLAIEIKGAPIPNDAIAAVNVALVDRFITGVSTGFCYVGASGNAKANLLLAVDASGKRRAEASHIVLNIDSDKVSIFPMRYGNENRR